ncbi:recombinase family protein [Bradyrhizobium ottawaense]|uniref:recombinase family protein n=1 Tax=Bradyrhizobium ottawaense TaxID=931866 RepID=UPI00384CFA9B
MTPKAIAKELNGREIMTPRGGRWYPSSVANLLRRLEELSLGTLEPSRRDRRA